MLYDDECNGGRVSSGTHDEFSILDVSQHCTRRPLYWSCVMLTDDGCSNGSVSS